MSRKKKKSGNPKNNNPVSAKDIIILVTAVVNVIRAIIDLFDHFTE